MQTMICRTQFRLPKPIPGVAHASICCCLEKYGYPKVSNLQGGVGAGGMGEACRFTGSGGEGLVDLG